MSASTPKPSAGNAPATVRSDAPLGPVVDCRSSAVWWLLSIAFHVLLLGWLLFLSPDRVIDLSAAKASSHVSSSRAHDVIEHVRERQTETLSSTLDQLRTIRGQLEKLEASKRDEFKIYARDLLEKAPQKIAETQDALAAAQAEAVRALNVSKEQAVHFLQTRAGVDYDNLAESQKLAKEAQAKTAAAQERLLEIFSLGDDQFAAAVEMQSKAMVSQEGAAQAEIDAEGARQPARTSRQRTQHEKDVDRAASDLKKAKSDLAILPEQIEKLSVDEKAAEAALQKVESAPSDTSSGDSEKSPTTKSSSKSKPETPLEKARKSMQSANRALADAQKRLENAPKRVADYQAKLDALLAQPDPMSATPTPEDRQLADRQAKANELQIAAQEAQSKVAAGILSDVPSKGVPGAMALKELDKDVPAVSVVDRPIREKNLAEVYSAGVENERSLAESYRRLRAVELSLIRRIPISRALQLVDVAKVVRPDLSVSLQASVNSGDDVPAAREAIQTARGQMAAMLQLAQSLLAQAQDLDHSAGSTISTDYLNERFNQMQNLEALAQESSGAWASDLTGAMEGGDWQSWQRSGGQYGWGSGGPGGKGTGRGRGGKGGPGSGGPGGGDGWSGGGGPGGGYGGGGPGGGLAGGGPGSSGSDGNGGPGRSGLGGSAGVSGTGGGGPSGGALSAAWIGGPGTTPLANAMARNLPASPGRSIAAAGTSPDWLYVDSWYILGPFDNTGRVNIDRQFPPETVIDLNAVYAGKKGVPIRWEFYQSSTPDVMPPFDRYNAVQKKPGLTPKQNYLYNLEWTVYYAYTELKFPQDCDLWVAIGSDDFSKIWVDDQLIWTSGKNLKGWQIDEGMRRVHFKKGVNRILYRVENANNITEFSFVICLRR